MASSTRATPTFNPPVTISDDADVTLRCNEYTRRLKSHESGDDCLKTSSDFHVNRDIMSQASMFFKTILNKNGFSGSGQDVIVMKELKPAPMMALLCVLHGRTKAHDTSDPGEDGQTLSLEADHLWALIAYAHRFGVELHNLDAWFASWYEYEDNNNLRADKLLYPCYQLRHYQGFLSASKEIVYGEIHIEEWGHPAFPEYHLPQRVIQQLRSARGRLRNLIADGIKSKVEGILNHNPPGNKTSTMHGYFRALLATGAWPVEKNCSRKSIRGVLRSLGTFRSRYLRVYMACCDWCGSSVTRDIEELCESVSDVFDGFCLDCMDHTQPKFLDEHEDYWNHLHQGIDWSKDCHVDHKKR